MGKHVVVPDHTVAEQRRAADPRVSAWVSANAGAGKTKVLTDRVVRLLLAGAHPGRLLCLTFTKAAAANMAIRVFERLGRWVTLAEPELIAELTELEGERPSSAKVKLARRLFARAVETPGGLKIETIHAFCERLLHLVPFEANVPARFAVLDESQTAELVAEATAHVLAEAATGDDAALAAALGTVSIEAAGDALATAIGCAIKESVCLERLGGLAAAMRLLRRGLELDDGVTAAEIERAMIEDGLPPAEWSGIAAALNGGKTTDQARGAALLAADGADDPDERLGHYLSVFFTEDDAPRAAKLFVTKSIDTVLKERLLDEQSRLIALADRRRAARTVERTGALFTLAGAITRKVADQKARLGALDFDDLIAKTVTLLRRGDTAWILYKLDRGIDHVLLDEAQDTNPAQWEILRLITAEFTAGGGARGTKVRTLFAVGDPKQSIYGFQGAEPREFERSRRLWRDKVGAAELAFADVRLTLSFRSAKAVLSAVDATFSVERHFRGLSFEDAAIGTVHESARPLAPGLVELWPTVRPEADDEPDAWTLPVDAADPTSPPVTLARQIARAVRIWTHEGDETGTVRRAGDILVLVRKRGAAFEAVIRALKEAGVPVAGADRIDIGEHIAVLDLVVAGRAALLPDDDLTLATALKSPLVGLDDADLIRIAVGRGHGVSLAAALADRAAAGDAAARRGCEALATWRDLARRHGPFGFYATLLGPLHGRTQLVARLGSEAGDAIDAFLCFAHNAELTETPSLTTFLERFQSASHQIKRDLDPSRDEVRVMTVHGAKGLEAPVVILIDSCEVLGRDKPLVVTPLPSGTAVPVWSPGKAYDCRLVSAAREAMQARGLEEHNRLLYVAMTRAEDRLVIAPFMASGKESPAEAWCEMVRRGFAHRQHALVHHDAPYGACERWSEGSFAITAINSEARAAALTPLAVPDWLATPVDPEWEPTPPIRPSSALAAADRLTRPGDGPYAPDARLRGVLVHALLERLPAVASERRREVARGFVAARAPRLPADDRARLVADALAVLGHAALAPLFGPTSRAEAAIAGHVRLGGEDRPVSGQIDRLAVRDDEILIADYKTTARPPKSDAPAPPAYVAQLALYRALLMDVYPDRRVRAFLIWTSGPLVRELREDELDGALATIKVA
jgi:ATP-dependent helicase/nuclease subunit A